MNWSDAFVVDVPTGVVTVTSTGPAASAGLVVEICVLLFTVNGVAIVPPNLTALAFVKFVPVIVTGVPPAAFPLFGDTPVTVGSDPSCCIICNKIGASPFRATGATPLATISTPTIAEKSPPLCLNAHAAEALVDAALPAAPYNPKLLGSDVFIQS